MKKFKKTIALICSMALLFSVFSASVLADGQNGESGNNAIEGNTSEAIELNQAYIDAHGGHMPVTRGAYVLSENITVPNGAKVETQDADITIDLNGYTITYTGQDSMYVLGKIRGEAGEITGTGSTWTTSPTKIDSSKCVTGVVLTINDSGTDGTISGAGYNSIGSVDYWINGSGVGTNAYRGGCVLIEYGSKMILNGGTITDFEASEEGGAICASNGSELEMNGGTIKNCVARNGGAIAAHASSSAKGPTGFENIMATFRMTGGTIYNNQAINPENKPTEGLGGGIRVNRCKFYLSGGRIYGNDANISGGGIDVEYANKNVVAIHGSPEIFDNTHNGALDERANLFSKNTGDNSQKYVQLDGDLSDAAVIHFGVQNNDNIAFKTNGNDYDMSSFHCDKAHYNACGNKNNGMIRIINTDIQYSVGIGGEITLLVRVKLSGSNAANAYVETSYEYTKNGSVKSKSVNVDIDDAKSNSGDYYTFAIPVESACMTAPIEISIHAGDNVITDSGVTIEKYAKVVKDQYSQYADLCDALLIFGGYAQVQLNINTDNLPTVSGVDFENGTADYGLLPSGFNTLPTGVAGNLSLLSQTEIKLRFKKADLGDTAPTMTIDGYSDTIEGEASGNYYIYTIKGPEGKGFNYSAYETTFNFTVGNISGTYSVYDYLRSVKSKSSSSAAWKNLVEAYYNFAKAVKAI